MYFGKHGEPVSLRKMWNLKFPIFLQSFTHSLKLYSLHLKATSIYMFVYKISVLQFWEFLYRMNLAPPRYPMVGIDCRDNFN